MTTEVLIPRKSSALVRVSCVVAFWVAAAVLVVLAHQPFVNATEPMCVAAKAVAIVIAAGAYMKIAARDATLDHALAVGVVWLVLAIVAEMIASRYNGRGWFDLIGSPGSALRNVLLIAWVIAPALFAKYGE